MSNDYTPISCAFYDELEAAAVKRTLNTIVYQENNETKTIEAKIIDFKTLEKKEYCILDNQIEIRLDYILQFNGISPQDKNYC